MTHDPGDSCRHRASCKNKNSEIDLQKGGNLVPSGRVPHAVPGRLFFCPRLKNFRKSRIQLGKLFIIPCSARPFFKITNFHSDIRSFYDLQFLHMKTHTHIHKHTHTHIHSSGLHIYLAVFLLQTVPPKGFGPHKIPAGWGNVTRK